MVRVGVTWFLTSQTAGRIIALKTHGCPGFPSHDRFLNRAHETGAAAGGSRLRLLVIQWRYYELRGKVIADEQQEIASLMPGRLPKPNEQVTPERPRRFNLNGGGWTRTNDPGIMSSAKGVGSTENQQLTSAEGAHIRQRPQAPRN